MSAQGRCLPGGGVCPRVSAQGVSAWGVSARGMSAQQGVSARVVSATPPRPEADTPCGQTDDCENITFTNFVCGR